MSFRVGEQEAMEFMSSGGVDSAVIPDISTEEFTDHAVGLFYTHFVKKGVAGMYQMFGPFPPKTEVVVALYSESIGVRYYLDWTVEASSWFLAFDLTKRPLTTNDHLKNMAHKLLLELSRAHQEWATKNPGFAKRKLVENEGGL